MLDLAVRIACLSNGCCDCSPGGDARCATGTCARRKRVIDAGAFRTARGSASGRIGRSTRLLAVRSRRLAARTERERQCTEEGGHCDAGVSAGPFMPQAQDCPYRGKRIPRSADMPASERGQVRRPTLRAAAGAWRKARRDRDWVTSLRSGPLGSTCRSSLTCDLSSSC